MVENVNCPDCGRRISVANVNLERRVARSYELCALDKDSLKLKLLSNFDRDVRQYLEQELKSQLKIQDRPVHGEYDG